MNSQDTFNSEVNPFEQTEKVLYNAKEKGIGRSKFTQKNNGRRAAAILTQSSGSYFLK